MRALFFGSPAFAVPCLDALVDIADVACVFSQPDRPAGRGLALAAPEVKTRALALSLRVEQPTKIRTPEFAELVRSFDADVAVVVAYGRILPKAILDAPRAGCLNVHASILPRWRGAAPIQWAVASGDRETGVTLMQMDEGLDTGPILAVSKTAIGDDETAGDLFARLAPLGSALLRAELARVLAGELVPKPQPEEGITHARMLEKSDGVLDFGKNARLVHAWARGMSPWPGAQTTLGDEPIKVHGTALADEHGEFGAPGTILAIGDEGITHARMLEKSDGVLDFGKDARLVHAWARGMSPWPGAQTTLGDEPIKVHGTALADEHGEFGAPGTILAIGDEGIRVACGRGAVVLRELQQAGRKRVPGAAFAAGARLAVGDRFGGRS